ncbi:MAG TPA: hypothetical protein VFR55_00170 [Dehalococcoidia bacterium]|nr:hypothetical protein [Dehalococcoidia bacterium]
MHIPGSSFLATVKQKLRKTPEAGDLGNGEKASPRLPPNGELGRGDGPEIIALASPSTSRTPRGTHEIVSPFIDPAGSKPGQSGREAGHPIPPTRPSDQREISVPSGNELAADIRPGRQVGPSDQAATSVPSGNELAADPGAPADAEVDDEGAATGSMEHPMEESSPVPASGKTELGELFARKSVVHPTIKALLERHRPVNTRALSQELKDFAVELGLASPDK